jgi:hypothetical protein
MAWYILDENNQPVKSNITDCGKWLQKNPERKAVKQEHIGDVFISTVFLGLDHSFQSDIPMLWETMIFGGEHDQYQDRYTSYEDALEGHQTALNLVNNETEK